MNQPNFSMCQLRRAVRLFNSEYASKQTNRHNRIAWLRAVHKLGERWLLAEPINKGA